MKLLLPLIAGSTTVIAVCGLSNLCTMNTLLVADGFTELSVMRSRDAPLQLLKVQ
jgi:hypothetical protein